MNYYFLVANLPELALDGDLPFSTETFRAMCAEHLSPRDLSVLDALLKDEAAEHAPALVREWRNRDTRIRNATTALRAARLKMDAAPHIRPQTGISFFVENAVNDAQSRATPLAREMALDRLRWQEAEELAGLDPFSLRAILSYAVKLRLATRWDSMNKDVGISKLNEIINRPPDNDEAQQETA